MIKIIKDGQKDFIARCSTCGCEFSYQLGDIGMGSVVCPCCGGYVAHKEFKGPSVVTDTHDIPCTVTQQTTVNWIAPDVTAASSNCYGYEPKPTTDCGEAGDERICRACWDRPTPEQTETTHAAPTVEEKPKKKVYTIS